MSEHKRKTLMIKRPSPSESGKPRPLPKVDVSESAAGATETDKIKPVSPKTSKIKRPDAVADNKGATARISLPDEAKIRKARRADEPAEKLPGAPEIMDAASNATRQIEIDSESVSQPGGTPAPQDTDVFGNNDATMQINADELEAADQDVAKIKVNDYSKMTEQATRVATGEISKISDEDIRTAGQSDARKKLADADADLQGNNDATMQIDADALKTGPIEKQLADADAELQGNNDATMQIDAEALRTGPIEKQLIDADAELESMNDQTMEIDPDSLQTADLSGDALKNAAKPDIMAQETMQMDPVNDADFNAATAEIQQPETPADTGKVKDSFNAMTMAMDPNELARELEKDKTQPSPVQDVEDRNQTMDLSDVKPKTILIKRPSLNEAPSAPTVKTVRPDAQTVRTSRPAPGEAPASGSSDGKTVKLRRPAGASVRPGAPVSRVAAGAGLEIQEDGSVANIAKVKAPPLGGAWLAVSILTLVIMGGAFYIALAVNMPELPMPGRIVNELGEIITLNT